MSYSFKRLGFEGVDVFYAPYVTDFQIVATKNSTTLTQHTNSNRLNFLRDFGIIDSLIVLNKKALLSYASTKNSSCIRENIFIFLSFVKLGKRTLSPLAYLKVTTRAKGEIPPLLTIHLSGAPNDNFRKNICSEDDLRSRIFGTFVVK